MVRLLAFCIAVLAVTAASRRRTRGLAAPMSLKFEKYFAVLDKMVGVQERELTFLREILSPPGGLYGFVFGRLQRPRTIADISSVAIAG